LVEEPSKYDWDTTPTTSTIEFFGGIVDHEAHRRAFGGDEEEGQRQEIPEQDQIEVTFGFPILDLTRDIPMKSIPPSALPHFHGMTSEEPDSFLFEFDILCCSYNYIRDAKKLKLFPATLNDLALRWFMGLWEPTIRSWDDMRIAFLKKYQEYCKTRHYHNDISRMQQQEYESLEDYVERFAYNL
jgi:hypothetical protein